MSTKPTEKVTPEAEELQDTDLDNVQGGKTIGNNFEEAKRDGNGGVSSGDGSSAKVVDEDNTKGFNYEKITWE